MHPHPTDPHKLTLVLPDQNHLNREIKVFIYSDHKETLEKFKNLLERLSSEQEQKIENRKKYGEKLVEKLLTYYPEEKERGGKGEAEGEKESETKEIGDGINEEVKELEE